MLVLFVNVIIVGYTGVIPCLLNLGFWPFMITLQVKAHGPETLKAEKTIALF
jgi:hypothetical protein